MDLQALDILLKTSDPTTIFGPNPDEILRKYRQICHPDLFGENTPEQVLAKEVFQALTGLHDDLSSPKPIIVGGKRSYQVLRTLATGDISDVYLVEGQDADKKQYVLKSTRVPNADTYLSNEYSTLINLHTQAANRSPSYGDSTYLKYIPLPIEIFSVRDKFKKKVNVFAHNPGFYTLNQIHLKYGAGLPGRHLGWIFKRCLTILGFCHNFDTIHAAFSPEHVLLSPLTHGLYLIGWIHSTKPGEVLKTIPTKYKDWYPKEVIEKKPITPALDIYLAAKCIVFLANGDLKTGDMPRKTVPERMQSFIKSCLFEAASMRPQVAWDLLKEFDELLLSMYGKPRFVKLEMP